MIMTRKWTVTEKCKQQKYFHTSYTVQLISVKHFFLIGGRNSQSELLEPWRICQGANLSIK